MGVKVTNPPWTTTPYVNYWATGRYYGIESQFNFSFGANGMSANVKGMPVIIPNPVTITSVGVEATVAGTTGAMLRIAMYSMMTEKPYPAFLLKDFGQIAADTTGFLSASASYYVTPGMYYFFASFYTPTTYPTCRNFNVGANTTKLFPLLGCSWTSINNTEPILYTISGLGPTYVNNGYPKSLSDTTTPNIESVNLSNLGNELMPRILIGV